MVSDSIYEYDTNSVFKVIEEWVWWWYWVERKEEREEEDEKVVVGMVSLEYLCNLKKSLALEEALTNEHKNTNNTICIGCMAN